MRIICSLFYKLHDSFLYIFIHRIIYDERYFFRYCDCYIKIFYLLLSLIKLKECVIIRNIYYKYINKIYIVIKVLLQNFVAAICTPLNFAISYAQSLLYSTI